MLSYISNGGRLGENISFMYGIFKFCKVNKIPYNKIILDINYENYPLTKNEKQECVFLNNIEMFDNIKNVFKKLPKNYFKDFKIIDFKFQYDLAQLNNFYYYNKIDKDENILFKNWWSLDEYWIKKDSQFDIELLNYICRPKTVVNRLYKKYRNLFNKKTTAIHVRRGDFLGIENNNILKDNVKSNFNFYFKFKKIYTKNEIDTLIRNFLSLDNNILIFSDDINWCKENFDLYKNVYFLNNKAYEDIILMSLCDNVVVNKGSSFSNIAYILCKGFKGYD